GISVADGAELRAFELLNVPSKVRPPVAQTDNGDPNRVHAVDFLWRSIAMGVLKSRRRSSPSDQPRTYATSISRASPKVEFARAVTCHSPVSPWGTRKRSK